MDGRGRSGSSSGPPAVAPVMSSYYGGGQPLTPSGDSAGSFSPRDRFWTQSVNNGVGSTTPDPWASSGGYTPQLLPPPSASQDGMTPNYSPASHHSSSHNNSPPTTFHLNIPNHPYSQQPNGMNGSSNSSDLPSPFSGPSPPNAIQPVPLPSPYGGPPNSNSPRSRQYTPSTTPSPHVNQQQHSNGMNGTSSHSSNDSPPNSANNNNNTFESYLNGGLEGSGGKGEGISHVVPGYRQGSGRYGGDGVSKADSDLYHQQQQPPYYHQNYGHYQQPQQQQPNMYYDAYPGRRPFEPYQPYPTNQYGEPGYGSGESQQQYNPAPLPNPNNAPGNSPREAKPPGAAGENGPPKLESCDPIQRDSKGFDDEANFEAVLQGHMNSFNMDCPNPAPTSYNSYDSTYDPQPELPQQPPHPSLENNSSNNSRDSSGKSDDSTASNSNPNPTPAKKATKKKKSKAVAPDARLKDAAESGSQQPPSFLGQSQTSPNPHSNSNSNEGGSGANPKSDEALQSTPTPYSEGGDASPNHPNTHSSNSSQASFDQKSAPPPSARKKKPWKKAKQVNSETLLEERERHCAEYISQQMAAESKGKGMKPKEDGAPSLSTQPPPQQQQQQQPYYHHHYEEKNITIDHQKESEQVKREPGESDPVKREPEDGPAPADEEEVKKERKDVPMVECGCFPVDEVHPEPGPFYTHLGAAHTLPELRELLEVRTAFRGPQLRFEKVIYTGKEGKTSQGCPLAKWILRRGSYEEQLLFLVKHRKGHKCATAWIVVCCVIWEGVPPHFSDNLYDTIVYKLNRFGIPTTRRSDTNEQRSCACQGVDPDTCGAAYSFGCAWSMFFNGCKYARSRNVRKFRLTEEHEESELEEKIQHLATHLAPLYERVAPESYRNQIEHENEGLECRMGYRPGRPFSGVTACVDYCSHAHKDAHNMINGCTLTVAFTRNRTIGKGDDEQYHVLPLYKLDETDEHGSKEGQKQKTKKGQLEILKKFPSKVRIRKVPLLPSRRRGKTKPPSSSSSSHSHHHHSANPKPSDLYSSDLSALSMPPPIKRDKLSIFDELNGPAGGSDLFDTRFHPHGPPPPFSNLLMSKSHGHSKLGMGMGMSLEDHVQSCQITSTVIDPDTGLWNPSPYGQVPPHHHPHGQPTPPFRSYFDSAPIMPTPPSAQYSSTPSQFGHNLDLGLGSGPRSGVQNPTPVVPSPPSNNGSGSSGNLVPAQATNTSTSGNSSSGTSGTMTTPGYTSMSPSILPSFRHTFMTEAESLSMLSSMSSPSGLGPAGTSPIADSTSSPRNGKPGSAPTPTLNSTPPQHSTPLTPVSNAGTPSAGFNHQDALGFNNSSSGYFNSPSAPPTGFSNSSNSSLYHPHAHHPTPTSCLSTPPSQGGSGSFGSSYSSPASSFAPPSMESHHHAAAFAAAGMNMNWNSNMGSSYGHSAYGSVVAPNPQPPPPPAFHPHHNQMSSLNMNMSPMSASYMNQYSPYGNQTNFMSSPSMQHAAAAAAVASAVGMHSHHHPHHHPPNPWANPLPSFMSSAGSGHMGHHAPPPPPTCFVAPPKPKVIPEVNEAYSDNEEAFKDSHLGGVAIALTHGAVILQCAKHEMHATTSLKSPNRLYPSRICLVFYQHKSMNNRFHGWSEWEKKIEAKKLQEVKLINQGKLEATPRKMKQLIKEGYLADTS